jgi:putative flippase GtrA
VVLSYIARLLVLFLQDGIPFLFHFLLHFTFPVISSFEVKKMSKRQSVEGKGTSGMLCMAMHNVEFDDTAEAVGETADTICNFIYSLKVIFWHNFKISIFCHHKLHYK